jgi:hypothetical protein
MSQNETLLPRLRDLSALDFAARYPGPYLVRERSSEERAGEVTRAIGLTLSPGQVLKIPTGKDAVAALAQFEADAEFNDQFCLYAVEKTTRNIFAGGITLGRAPNNDVFLPLASVSKFHAWLCEEKGAFSLFDARSRFGSFVEETRAAPEGDVGLVLSSGVWLRLGEVKLRFWDATGLHRWFHQHALT